LPYAFLDHPVPIAFAHRGGAGERPENSWSAFAHAVELGYRYIETDAHATADGVVVLSHDPTLDRTTDRSGRIRAMTWEQVRSARVGESDPIPRLDEVLAAWPQLRWNIDAKAESVVGPLVETLARTRTAGRVCLASFRDRRVRRLQAAVGPDVCSAPGSAAVAALRLGSLAPRLIPSRRPTTFGAVQVPIRWAGVPIVDERFVDLVHRRGLALHVWTVDEESAMEGLIDLGADGIMTDHPARLRRVLERRGCWA
jgi:glycerophosphoryl diester phosphodiesterase